MKEPYIPVNEPLYGRDNIRISALSNETRAAYKPIFCLDSCSADSYRSKVLFVYN